MADAPDAPATSEPSMEEILASIRKIIADEKDPAASAAPAESEDVLERTQMVQDDGSVTDLSSAPPAPEPAAAPVFDEEPAPPPPPPSPPPAMEAPEESLISRNVAGAASSSLAALANTVQIERLAASTMTPIGNGARTLEDMVMELMKPMLKTWLDQNLPAVVDRLVQKEVERISRKAQE